MTSITTNYRSYKNVSQTPQRSLKRPRDDESPLFPANKKIKTESHSSENIVVINGVITRINFPQRKREFENLIQKLEKFDENTEMSQPSLVALLFQFGKQKLKIPHQILALLTYNLIHNTPQNFRDRDIGNACYGLQSLNGNSGLPFKTDHELFNVA